MQQNYFSKFLISGSEVLHDQIVTVEDTYVTSIAPYDHETIVSDAVKAHYLVPSFIDLQIYGAGGRLFSMYPSAETLHTMYEECLKSGTAQFLVTIATNTLEVIKAGIDAIKDYWKLGGKGILGLHLEGPWINKIKRGAHIEAFIKSPEIAEVSFILNYGRDVIKMITLAPEVCHQEVLNLIRSYGITISAGHSDATFAQATASFSKGINAVTHLFNAMSSFHHRDTGLAGAAFEHSTVMSSIIVDGYHVDYTAVKIAKRLMGDRLFLITDAVTETNGGPYPHIYHEGRYLSLNTLSGSALSMLQAVKNCIEHCGMPPDEAFKMASLYPARLLNIPGGTISIGQTASFISLDENLEVLDSFN